MELIPNERLYRSENFVYDDEKVWTKLCWYNDILEIDRKTGEARVIPLPKEYDNIIWGYRTINKHGRKIYVIPFRARELLVLDLNTEQYERVPLPNDLFDEGQTEGFMQSVIVDNRLIMFGYYPMFVSFDIIHNTFSVVKGIEELYDSSFAPAAWMAGWSVIDKELFIHIAQTNTLVVLNVDSGDFRLLRIGTYEYLSGFCGVEGSKFWFDISNEGEQFRIVSWDFKDNSIDEFLIPKIKNTGLRPVSWFIVFEKKVWIIPGKLDKAYCYCVEDGSLQEVADIPAFTIDEMDSNPKEPSLNYFGVTYMEDLILRTKNNEVLVVHPWSGQLVELALTNKKIRSLKLLMNAQCKRRLEYEELLRTGLKIQNGVVYDETDKCGLIEYLTMIDQGNSDGLET